MHAQSTPAVQAMHAILILCCPIAPQAAACYDAAARDIRGDAAVCNFPLDGAAPVPTPKCAL